MNELKNAYFAGLIDGEGHVIIKKRIHPSGHVQLVPSITVGMTDEQTIQSIHDHFQVGSLRSCDWHNTKNSRYKKMFYWEAGTNNAKFVAKCIEPYAITKLNIIREIINVDTGRPGGKPGIMHHNAKFTQEQVDAIRAEHKTLRENATEVPRGWLIQKGIEYGVSKHTINQVLRYGYGLPSTYKRYKNRAAK